MVRNQKQLGNEVEKTGERRDGIFLSDHFPDPFHCAAAKTARLAKQAEWYKDTNNEHLLKTSSPLKKRTCNLNENHHLKRFL